MKCKSCEQKDAEIYRLSLVEARVQNSKPRICDCKIMQILTRPVQAGFGI